MAIVYGVRSEEDAAKDTHFSRCAECARRLGELRRRRDAILAPVPLVRISVPESVVVAQRQSIMQRVAAARDSKKSPSVAWWRPLAALAAAATLLVGILVRVPVPVKEPHAVLKAVASSGYAKPVDAKSGDAKFFAEVMYEASRTESAALRPLHYLFQTETQTKAVRQ